MAFHWRIVHSRLGLFVFATFACLQFSVTLQSCSRKQHDFGNISETHYSSDPRPVSGAILVLYRMVHGFIDIVQPNPFPTDIVKTLVKDASELENKYQKVLLYEIGFIVCAIIGILFFLFMPLVGLCFCCCRCCGNCGGKLYQEQTKSTNCRRKTLATILFLVTTVILAGNVCMFISNEKVTESLQDSGNLLGDTLRNLKTYLNAIPKQITAITNACAVPINSVTDNLDNIGSDLGVTILKILGETTYDALNSASQLAQDITEMNDKLLVINSTATRLLQQQEVLEQNLTAIRQDINNTFNKCGSGCSSSQGLVANLILSANFSTIPKMDKEIRAMEELVNANLSFFIQEGYKAFNDTPALLVNQSANTVTETKKSIKNIEMQIKNITNELPVLTSITSVSSEIDNINTSMNKYLPQVQQGDKYRRIVGIVLSCIILLVVLCNYLGMLLGATSLDPNVDPTERSLVSNCGGNLFMAGASFSFTFSWLLMLFVFIMFIVGGNVYSLVCKPWYNDELFQIIETSGLSAKLNLAQSFGLKNTTLNISNIYNDCQNNTPIWKVLKLSQTFNLDEHLNLSKYTGNIANEFDRLTINLSEIVLLNDKGKKIVNDLPKTGINDLNFTSISKQLRMPIIQGELLYTAEKLENLSKEVSDPTKTNLGRDAANLKKLNNWVQNNMVPNIENLKENIENLQAKTSQIEVNVNATLSNVTSAQTFLQTKGSDIIKNETKAFLDCQLAIFDSYVSWTMTMITEDLARCRPVAEAVNDAETITCTYLLDSLNAFWFSMGWSTIFLIPSIIFAVKLSKFYRRMTTSDVYENSYPQFEMRPLRD